MKVSLVAPAWNSENFPSPALGVLTALLDEHASGHETACHYSYLDLHERLGSLYGPISQDRKLSELLFLSLVYPDRQEAIRRYCIETPELSRVLDDSHDPQALVDFLFEQVRENVASTTHEILEANSDVAAFTTTYLQLFASVAIARALRSRGFTGKIVFGGMGVSFGCGPSILGLFDEIDHIMPGYSEWVFLDWVKRTVDTTSRKSDRSLLEPNEKIPRFAELPPPDYRGYAELAEDAGIAWTIPIEGSRGCWWDRVARRGDALDTCRFCTENDTGYAERGPARVAHDMEQLAMKYNNTRFMFTDFVMRKKGIMGLANQLAKIDLPLEFFYELRANIRPEELVAMWRAGCRSVQLGVEGLSTAYLRRIGKGTTAIQNLQAMKTAFELRIHSNSNILTEFPGASAAEVEETARVIREIAVAYQPLNMSRFALSRNSAVEKLPDHFGIENLRNPEIYRASMPQEVFSKIELPDLEFDLKEPAASWSPVVDALSQWRMVHKRIRDDDETFFNGAPLCYLDRGFFLEITDRRTDEIAVVELEPDWASLYLYCTEIRHRGEIAAFCQSEGIGDVDDKLESFLEEKLMFCEGTKFLSLATATSPEIAAARIDAFARTRRTKPSLEVVGG